MTIKFFYREWNKCFILYFVFFVFFNNIKRNQLQCVEWNDKMFIWLLLLSLSCCISQLLHVWRTPLDGSTPAYNVIISRMWTRSGIKPHFEMQFEKHIRLPQISGSTFLVGHSLIMNLMGFVMHLYLWLLKGSVNQWTRWGHTCSASRVYLRGTNRFSL